MGPQTPPILPFLGKLGGPKTPPKIFFGLFSSFYHFVWTLSFPGLLYISFYNDFKGFYDTFKIICIFGKKLGVLHNKNVQISQNFMGPLRFFKLILKFRKKSYSYLTLFLAGWEGKKIKFDNFLKMKCPSTHARA